MNATALSASPLKNLMPRIWRVAVINQTSNMQTRISNGNRQSFHYPRTGTSWAPKPLRRRGEPVLPAEPFQVRFALRFDELSLHAISCRRAIGPIGIDSSEKLVCPDDRGSPRADGALVSSLQTTQRRMVRQRAIPLWVVRSLFRPLSFLAPLARSA